MNSLLIACIAAAVTAWANFFFRKDSVRFARLSANGYLVCYYFISLLTSFVIFPEVWKVPFSLPMAIAGGAVGILNVGVMVFMAQALKQGPSGITFALQNVSSIFPGLLLFIIFGPDFGFEFTYLQAIGICLVTFGLFLGVKGNTEQGRGFSLSWLKYALGCFLFQILALTLIQWRCLLFGCDTPHTLIPTVVTPSEDAWFMPGFFGAAFLFQFSLLVKEKRMFHPLEMAYGSMGGLLNGISTFLLLFATKLASPLEKGILLPCFAISTIVACNLWANRLYNERFNLFSNTTCSLGIIIGSLIP